MCIRDSQTVCAEELPFEWNGQTLNAAGQLVNRITDANGCEYDEILNLTVNAETPAEITDQTVCAEELPFEWNGQTLNAAGQLVNRITDANGCEYDEILNLTVNAETPAEITNQTVCAEELPFEWNGQTLNAAGQLVNRITDANGCEYLSLIHISEPTRPY